MPHHLLLPLPQLPATAFAVDCNPIVLAKKMAIFIPSDYATFTSFYFSSYATTAYARPMFGHGSVPRTCE